MGASLSQNGISTLPPSLPPSLGCVKAKDSTTPPLTTPLPTPHHNLLAPGLSTSNTSPQLTGSRPLHYRQTAYRCAKAKSSINTRATPTLLGVATTMTTITRARLQWGVISATRVRIRTSLDFGSDSFVSWSVGCNRVEKVVRFRGQRRGSRGRA